MLKPHEMASVIITGPKNLQEKIIEELHSMKILHIVDHSKSELADIGVPLDCTQRYSEAIVKARALISALGIKKMPVSRRIDRIEEMEKIIDDTAEQLASISQEIKSSEEEKSANDALVQELEMLKGIDIPIENICSIRSLACFTGFAKSRESLDLISRELSKFHFATASSEARRNIFSVIFVDANARKKSEEILQKNGFLIHPLSYSINLKGTAASNLEKAANESSRIAKSRQAGSEKLEKLKSEKKDDLIAIESSIAEKLEKAEAPLRFANTKSSFLIKGWIPEEDLSKSVEKLEKAANGKIHVYHESPKSSDKVPVKLNNAKIAKPFEFFIDLYSYPTHREIDPTLFMFFTFPIFFGVMLGDIGYGLVGLAVFLFAKKIMPEGKSLLNSLIAASLASVLFGFIFGEIFGYEFIHHPIISREHEMMKLMYFAIGLGIAHVNIGLIAGFANELKSHGFMHAVYAKLSWIILEAGVALVAIPHVTSIKIAAWIGYSVIGLAVIMLFMGEGVRGLIELPSIFTNILSYARLMAIGLSSVIIAVIVNESAFEMIHQGGFMIAAGILILIVGHALNILLGLFGSFLHALRLHYVEFFSKFFHGGGKKYAPFGLRE